MYRFLKRSLDLLVSLFLLVLLLPLFIIVAIGLKFSGDGEVFYFQKRIGFPNEYFNIYKFATMLKDSPNIGSGMITLRDDPRVTSFGSFLRKSKINELPQILNVIKGDMSLVGPRPTVKKHYEAYSVEDRKKIYNIKPGISGVGAIIFRDEEELISNSSLEPFVYYKEIIVPYKKDLEFWYLENRSFIVDIKILFITGWVILFPKSKIYTSIFNNLPTRNF